MGNKGTEPTEGRKAISTKFQQQKSRPPQKIASTYFVLLINKMFDVIYSYKVKEETGINLQLLTTELHGRMCMEEHVITISKF